MGQKRRTFSSEFKSRVVRAALREDKTLAQLANMAALELCATFFNDTSDMSDASDASDMSDRLMGIGGRLFCI